MASGKSKARAGRRNGGVEPSMATLRTLANAFEAASVDLTLAQRNVARSELQRMLAVLDVGTVKGSSAAGALATAATRDARSAGAQPAAPGLPSLLDLPDELVVQVLRHCETSDLARVRATCRHLHRGPPPLHRPMSAVEEALRLRAEEGRHWVPVSLPEGSTCWEDALLSLERRRAASMMVTASGSIHSLFVHESGQLYTLGYERVESVDSGEPQAYVLNRYSRILVAQPHEYE